MLLDKVDVRPIIRAHYRTLCDAATGRVYLPDIALFFVLPVVIAVAAYIWNAPIRPAVVNGLLTAFSIFVGLLFNVLVMVNTFLHNTQGEPTDPQLQQRKALLREVTANLSFAILEAVGLCAASIVALMLIPLEANTAPQWLAALMCGGSLQFLLVLLMILRRLFTLLQNEFDRHRIRKAA